jgi:hypothetical protein
MKENKSNGIVFLFLALIAFGGLGLELPLGIVLEPMIYGTQIDQWSVVQNVVHWVLTCIIWGIVATVLFMVAKKKYSFDLFSKSEKPKTWQWFAVGLCIVFSLAVSYLDWNGFKVVKEFQFYGWIKFIFQYIYYIVETGLVILIIIFGQKAGEILFYKKNIPYGGIVTAITWGLVHTITKGDIMAGITCMISGLLFGVVYLLVNRNIRLAFPILLIMFIL